MLHQCQHNNWGRDTCVHPFVVITLFSFASFRPSACILDFFRYIKCCKPQSRSRLETGLGRQTQLTGGLRSLLLRARPITSALPNLCCGGLGGGGVAVPFVVSLSNVTILAPHFARLKWRRNDYASGRSYNSSRTCTLWPHVA